MTRWHEDDLAGRLQRATEQGGWELLSFPAVCEAPDVLGRRPGEALWPERFPLRDEIDAAGRRIQGLESIRAEKPLFWWLALYQQRPGHHHSVLWPPHYFVGDELWFDVWPGDLKLRVMTLDPSKGGSAASGDYSAYVLLGVRPGGLVFVEADLSNTRPPTELVLDGVRLYRQFQPDVFGVEANAWQDLLRPMFARELAAQGLLGIEPAALENRTTKRLRIESLDSLLRERLLRFRRTAGTKLLVEQLQNYPVARHDDGPDALEMAVRLAQECLEVGRGQRSAP